MTNSQPFTVTCVTCGSRLKVANRALIGSIESCPKCGAMVQIAEPEPQLVIGDPEDVDSGAITQSAIEQASSIADAPPDEKRSVQPASRQAAFIAPPPPHQDKEVDAGSGELHDPFAAGIPSESQQYRLEMDSVLQSEATQRLRQMVLIGLLSVFGLVTATIVFSQFVRTWRANQTAQGDVVTPADAVDSESNELATGDGDAATTVDTNTDTEATEAALPSADATLAEAPMNVEESPREDGDASVPGDQSAEPAPSDPPEVMETPEQDLPPQDVPSQDAATAVVGNRDGDLAAPVNVDEVGTGMTSLPPGLAKFIPITNLATIDSQGVPRVQPPPTIDTVRIDEAAVAAEPGAEVASKRKPIEVSKLFAQRFAIDNQGASLADLMIIVSQLTTVPVELDLITLDVAGVNVDTPIKTPTGWMTSKQWVEGTCAALGLVSMEANEQVTITAAEDRLIAATAPSLALDDFGDEAKATFEWIQPLLVEDEEVVAEPVDEAAEMPEVKLTSLSDDARMIIPGSSMRSKLRAFLAIEAVRQMRQMPAKAERWRTVRWLGRWPEEDAVTDGSTFGEWPLVSGGKSVAPLDSPRAAAGLLRSIAALNGAQVVVGWYDAQRLGFFPADPVMPYSRDETAGAMLDEILGEQGLQARVCGPSLWYVCSEASYDRLEVFAWYAIPAGTGEAIRRRLANSLSVADPTTLPLVFTDDRMIVRCPRFLARQISRVIEP
jgi:hypothetical protein